MVFSPSPPIGIPALHGTAHLFLFPLLNQDVSLPKVRVSLRRVKRDLQAQELRADFQPHETATSEVPSCSRTDSDQNLFQIG